MSLLFRLARLPRFLRRIFVLFLAVFLVTSFFLLLHLNDRLLVEIPKHGGELSEGIIGRPRFINPVIAKSDADRDIAGLIYSGLLRATPGGLLIPDLAEQYIISPDGLTYTFTLKDGLLWHDGTPITSDDVLFTIEKVRDPGIAIKSPRRASWEGVEVETPDPRTVVFHIKQPYAPFLENALMGILPKHIWQNVPNEEFDVTYYNIEPIGSGPYRIERVVRDSDKGLPSYYDLVAFKHYALGEPYITHLKLQFFGNNKELEAAYQNQLIDQMHTVEPSLAAEFEKTGARIERTPLPRIFAAYFNQNQQPIFVEKAVREALATAVDKEQIVTNVLHGYGIAIDAPLPFIERTGTSSTPNATTTDRRERARAILERAGWAPNTAGVYEKTDKKKKQVTLLQFSLALPDIPELKQAAELMKNDWEKMGALVTLKVFESSTFAGEILAPRKYDLLFYGQVISRTPDMFSYWHSSQRNAPGLNIALYTNKNVDKFLEEARKERDEAARTVLYEKFLKEIDADIPAIFVYSPDFLYAVSKKVRGMEAGLMITESERFLGIHDWYIESERVWTWFRDRLAR